MEKGVSLCQRYIWIQCQAKYVFYKLKLQRKYVASTIVLDNRETR